MSAFTSEPTLLPERRGSALAAHQAALRKSGACFSPTPTHVAIAGVDTSPDVSPSSSPTRTGFRLLTRNGSLSRSSIGKEPWSSLDGTSLLPLASGWNMTRRCSDESAVSAGSSNLSSRSGGDSRDCSPTQMSFNRAERRSLTGATTLMFDRFASTSPTDSFPPTPGLVEDLPSPSGSGLQRRRTSSSAPVRRSSGGTSSEPPFLLTSHASLRRSSHLSGSTSPLPPVSHCGSRRGNVFTDDSVPFSGVPAYLVEGALLAVKEAPQGAGQVLTRTLSDEARQAHGIQVHHLPASAIAARHTALIVTPTESPVSSLPAPTQRRASSPSNLRTRRMGVNSLTLDTSPPAARFLERTHWSAQPAASSSLLARRRASSNPVASTSQTAASGLLPAPMIVSDHAKRISAPVPPASDTQALSLAPLVFDDSESDSDGTLTPNCYSPTVPSPKRGNACLEPVADAAAVNAQARRSFARAIRRASQGEEARGPLDIARERELAPTPPLGERTAKPRLAASMPSRLAVASQLERSVSDTSPLELPLATLWSLPEEEVPSFSSQMPLSLPVLSVRKQMEEEFADATDRAAAIRARKRNTVCGVIGMGLPSPLGGRSERRASIATPSSVLAAAADARLTTSARHTRRTARPLSWAAGSSTEACARLAKLGGPIAEEAEADADKDVAVDPEASAAAEELRLLASVPREYSSSAARRALQAQPANILARVVGPKPPRPPKSKLRSIAPSPAAPPRVALAIAACEPQAVATEQVQQRVLGPVPPSLRADFAAISRRRASLPGMPAMKGPASPLPRLVAPKPISPTRPTFVHGASFVDLVVPAPCSPSSRRGSLNLGARIPSLDEASEQHRPMRRHSLLLEPEAAPREEHRTTPRPDEDVKAVATSGNLLC
jgi:hypothetical protein